MVAVTLTKPGGVGRLEGLPYYLAYLQNVPRYYSASSPRFPSWFFHTWTLAIEEQFYILWPFLVSMLGRAGVLPICVACLGLATWARVAGFDDYLLLTNCDGFACGGLLALILADPARDRAARAGLRVALVPLSGLMVLANFNLRGLTPAFRRAVGLVSQAAWQSVMEAATNLFFMVAVGLIVLGSGRPSQAWLRHRAWVYLGAISYGVYLYHYPIYAAVDALAARYQVSTDWWHATVKVGLTIAAAMLSWRYVERPILALKSRFDYAKAPAPAPEMLNLEAMPGRG